MQNVFPKLSETPGAVRLPAPDIVGQHTDEILSGLLGMTPAGIGRLRKDGVI
jgi:formyl-CoA transferase